MKIDSVFAIAPIPNENDRPPIPVERITDAMDAVEEPAIALMTRTLNRETDALLERADSALARGDSDAIRLLNWGARADLERAIASVWSNGWLVGQQQGLEEMRLAVPKRLREESRFAVFATDPGLLAAIARLLTLGVVNLGQSAAAAAVQERVFRLAGDFSDDTLNRLKGHLVAAIEPQPATGAPISRRELLGRIESTLNVSRGRATTIARTETTNAYNAARVESFGRSPLVTHLRFLSIADERRTEVCASRAGMIVPITDRQAIARNQPALHFRCFPAGTKILMADGSQKNIESVKIGQSVKTSTASEVQKVYNVMKSSITGFLLRIRLEDGRTIETTPDHPFWDGQNFVAASSLCGGQELWVHEQVDQRKQGEPGLLVLRSADAVELTCGKDWSGTQDASPCNGARWDKKRSQCGDRREELGRVSKVDAFNAANVPGRHEGYWPYSERVGHIESKGALMAQSIASSDERAIGSSWLSVAARRWFKKAGSVIGRGKASSFRECSTNRNERPWSVAKNETAESFQESRSHSQSTTNQKASRSQFQGREKSLLWKNWRHVEAGAYLQNGMPTGLGGNILPLGLGGKHSKGIQSLRNSMGARAKSFSIARWMDLPTGFLSSRQRCLGRGQGALDRGRQDKVRHVQGNLPRAEGKAYRRGEVSAHQETFQGITPLRIVSIEKIPFQGFVYNISVELDEVYFANGIFVHNCRSVLSPLTPRINPAHQAMIDDDSRRPENRALAPLMPGWNGAPVTPIAPAQRQPETPRLTIPPATVAQGRLKKVGEGTYGEVYRDGAIAYKYGDIEDKEIAIAREMGELGIGPRVLGGDRTGYAMEYLDGYTTQHRMLINEDFNALPTAETINRNTIETLRRMHLAGYAHNDLHKANVMVNVATGDVKIIDYGFAADANGAIMYGDARNLLRSNQFLNTVDSAKFRAAGRRLEKTASELAETLTPDYNDRFKTAVDQFYDEVLSLNLAPKTKRRPAQEGQPAIARNSPGPRPEPQRIAAAANPLVRRGRELAAEIDDIDLRSIGRTVKLYNNAKTLDDNERYGDRGAQRMQQIKEKILERSRITPDDARAIANAIEINGLDKEQADKMRSDLAEIFRLTGGRGRRSLQEVRATGNVFRAFADDGIIDMGAEKYPRGRLATLMHEVGHHVEFEDAEIGRMTGQWVRNVAIGPVETLNAIANTTRYGNDEIGFRDHFVNPYVGKFYGDGSTEVVAVGLEHFTDGRKMFELYRRDPDHFYMMLGILL